MFQCYATRRIWSYFRFYLSGWGLIFLILKRMSDFLLKQSSDIGTFYEVDNLPNILKTVHDSDRVMGNCSCALKLFFLIYRQRYYNRNDSPEKQSNNRKGN